MPTLEVKRTNPVLVWGAGFLILVLLFIGIRLLTRERVQVRVAQTSYQNLLRQVSTNGKVEPIQEFQAHAAAPGEVSQEPIEQRKLVGASSQHAGRGYRMHEIKRSGH